MSDKALSYVIAGNPNVGKSVVFNALTNTYRDVSNYPGTTVDIAKGSFENKTLIDTPGVYGIGSFSEEEKVTKDILLKYNKIINVVSAVSLERDLFLTQQLIDMGFELIVVLNQIDEAQARGIQVDIEKLQGTLGVDVYPTIATKKIGINHLKNNLNNFKQGNKTEAIEKLSELVTSSSNKNHYSSKEKVLFLEGDDSFDFTVEKAIDPDEIYTLRRNNVDNITKNCIEETLKDSRLSAKIGVLLLHPLWGSICALFILIALYQIIGVFLAGDVVGYFSDFVTNNINPFFSAIVTHFSNIEWLNQLLVGDYGVITFTAEIIIGIILPLVGGFYIFFSILEDSGYLPRLAVLCDRGLSYIGLNGKAIIPLILGFGCITMAVISSRTLSSKREKLITIVILSLAIPCSAQLGIILALLASVNHLWVTVVFISVILIVLLLVILILNKFLPGTSEPLILDLPVMRVPTLKNIIIKSYTKIYSFLIEAIPLFAVGSLVLGILSVTGGLAYIHVILQPVIVGFLKLPAETSDIFIMSLIRKDFGVSGLFGLAGVGEAQSFLTTAQILVCLVVTTLFVPCISSVIVMFKEIGWLQTLVIWLLSMVIALITGGILAFILSIVL